MSLDPELELWQGRWRTDSDAIHSASTEIQRGAVRQEKSLRLKLCAELVAACIYLFGSAALVRFDPSFEMVLWAACVWIATFLATAMSLWNWNTLWRDSAQSVADFTSLYRKRAEASIRATTLGTYFLWVQAGVSFAWFSIDLALGRVGLGRFLFAMVLLLAVIVTFAWQFRRSKQNAFNDLNRAMLTAESESDCA